MKRLVIAVDCDDVLVPCGQKTVDIYNTMYGTQVGLADLYDSPLGVWGVKTTDEVLRRLDGLFDNYRYEFLQPFPEAIPSIERLARNHELHLVTGRRDFLEPITQRTLEGFFPECFRTVEHTNHFAPSGEAPSRRSKGEVCRQLGASLLIDDHHGHIASAVEYGVKGILFGHYPWNQTSELSPGVVRCSDWLAVEEVIKELTAPIMGVAHG